MSTLINLPREPQKSLGSRRIEDTDWIHTFESVTALSNLRLLTSVAPRVSRVDMLSTALAVPAGQSGASNRIAFEYVIGERLVQGSFDGCNGLDANKSIGGGSRQFFVELEERKSLLGVQLRSDGTGRRGPTSGLLVKTAVENPCAEGDGGCLSVIVERNPRDLA